MAQVTIELPILGLLKDRPMHGYELRQALERVVGHFASASWGSLYPMLQKLEQRGYLSKASEPPDKGPERIVYGITLAGERRLIQILMGDDGNAGPAQRDSFLLKVAFLHVLTPPQRLDLLEAQAAVLRERLEGMQAEQARVGERTNRYRRALLDYALNRLRTDLDWVAALIRQEREER